MAGRSAPSHIDASASSRAASITARCRSGPGSSIAPLIRWQTQARTRCGRDQSRARSPNAGMVRRHGHRRRHHPRQPSRPPAHRRRSPRAPAKALTPGAPTPFEQPTQAVPPECVASRRGEPSSGLDPARSRTASLLREQPLPKVRGGAWFRAERSEAEPQTYPRKPPEAPSRTPHAGPARDRQGGPRKAVRPPGRGSEPEIIAPAPPRAPSPAFSETPEPQQRSRAPQKFFRMPAPAFVGLIPPTSKPALSGFGMAQVSEPSSGQAVPTSPAGIQGQAVPCIPCRAAHAHGRGAAGDLAKIPAKLSEPRAGTRAARRLLSVALCAAQGRDGPTHERASVRHPLRPFQISKLPPTFLSASFFAKFTAAPHLLANLPQAGNSDDVAEGLIRAAAESPRPAIAI